MRTTKINLDLDTIQPPQAAQARIDSAVTMVEEISSRSDLDGRIPQFVATGGNIGYMLLRSIQDQYQLASGTRFFEFGCGIGQVSLLASKLGFEASGVEIEQDLVEHGQRLANSNHINVQLICGSMFPAENEAKVRQTLEQLYADTRLFFVYPWPSQRQLTLDLFAQCGSPGSMLLQYFGGVQFTLWQNTE